MQEVKLKVAIVGDGASGKSALLQAYSQKTFNMDYKPTVIDNFEVTVGIGENRKCVINILDTAGQEDFKSIRKLTYPGCDVFVICYNCVGKTSFENVESVWIPELKTIVDRLNFVLCGNKADLIKKENPSKVVSESDGQMLAGRYSGCYASLQCSALLYGRGQPAEGRVNEVFKEVIKCGLERKLVQGSPCEKCCIIA